MIERESKTIRITQQFQRQLEAGSHPNIVDFVEMATADARESVLAELLEIHQDWWRGSSQMLDYVSAVKLLPNYETQIRRFFQSGTLRASHPQQSEHATDSLLTIYAEPEMRRENDAAAQMIAGRYRITRTLGEGSYGIVYMAFDETLQRPVAVKLSRTPQSEAAASEFNSFLEESRILSDLEHPRILPVLDAGVTDEGYQFFVSKFLSGGSLEDRMGNGNRLSIVSSLGIVRNISDALQHAHEKGLFHRDVKLANIIFDDAGNPFLADFGLALRDAERRERTGTLAGTPAFMAPEQVQATSTCIDGRTDIWAIGIVLYYLLTDQYPFCGRDLKEIFGEILDHEPRPPRQINPKVSKDLESLTLRCLEKDISKRISSAAELSEELDSILQASTKSVSRSAAPEKEGVQYAGRFRTAMQLIVAVAALGLCALAVAPVIRGYYLKTPSTAHEVAGGSAIEIERPAIRLPPSPNASDEPASQPTAPPVATTSADMIAAALPPPNQNVAVNSNGSGLPSTLPETLFQMEKATGKESSERVPREIGEPPYSISEVDLDSSGSIWINEDFTSNRSGALPIGWIAPLNRFRIAGDQRSRGLVMPGSGIGKFTLPLDGPASKSELEFEFELKGNHSSPQIQVDLLGSGMPCISVGVYVKNGRQITTIVGADGSQADDTEIVTRWTSRLRLMLDQEILQVSINDRLCHTIQVRSQISKIRIGLTKNAQLNSATCRILDTTEPQTGFNRGPSWVTMIDEDFADTPAGTLPDGWEANDESFGVGRSDGWGRLTATSNTTVRLPLNRNIESDFILESEFLIPGGYSSEPRFTILLDSPTSSSSIIGCYVNANKFCVSANGTRPDHCETPWPKYMSGRARVRLERLGKKIFVFIHDELFQTLTTDQVISGVGFRLGDGAELYWARLTSAQKTGSKPQDSP